MYASNAALGMLLASTCFGIAIDTANLDAPSSIPNTAAGHLPVYALVESALFSFEECQKFDKEGRCLTHTDAHHPPGCGPKHKNRQCDKDDCCSANGRCGQSESFCGKHCQHDYGRCWTLPNTKLVSGPGRCGKGLHGGNSKCIEGLCCSGFGRCGEGAKYCSVPFNCQPGFSKCDSDALPKGMDLLSASQPRDKFGNVSYGEKITRCKKPSVAALTFDDGPSNNTAEILDVLRDHEAKATFFITGNNDGKGMIDENEVWISIVKRIIDEGHQIGSHTWTHQRLDKISHYNRVQEMGRNDRAISNIIGKFPTYMRPPFSQCSQDSGCLSDMADLGYHIIEWDIDSHDWEPNQTLTQVEATVDRTMDSRENVDNMILIQHDHSQHAIALTKHVLEKVQQKGWQAVTVGECMEDYPEFWYRTPTMVEPYAIAGVQGGVQGCVVSEPGFCGETFRFEDEKGCFDSIEPCLRAWIRCTTKFGYEHSTCEDYRLFCANLSAFCQACKSTDQLDCKNDWSYNRHDNS